jgi:hypothetical protein
MEDRQPLGEGEIYCPSCGAAVKRDAEICMSCGVRVRRPPAPRQTGGRTAKPVVGGILGIVAGIGPLIAGIVLMAIAGAARSHWDPVEWVPMGIGIGLFILGVITVVGSSFAVARKNFVLSVIGGVCAVFSFWILGIPALILIAVSSSEFYPPEQG